MSLKSSLILHDKINGVNIVKKFVKQVSLVNAMCYNRDLYLNIPKRVVEYVSK